MPKLQLGKRNLLRVQRILPHGAYLDGGEIGDILLPARYLPQDTKVGDQLDVFLYLDHEERLTATTQHPLIQVGEYAYLQCTWVNQYGAFLDWGLQKDLFCPFREQRTRMQVGKRYMVYCYIDDLTYRILCTSRIDRLKAAVEEEGWKSQSSAKGGKVPGVANHIPSASLRSTIIDDFAPRLESWLNAHDGHCPLGDHSPAEDIYQTFGVSKRVFKQAVGKLYKEGIITILPDGSLQIVVSD